MSFKKWLDKYDEAFHDSLLNYSEKSGLKLKGNQVIIPKGLDEQTLHLFTAYRNQRTTKMLVWATWILALSTIILSIITILNSSYLEEFLKFPAG